MIEIDDLHKTFPAKTGAVHAVRGVSFGARDGEITGLLGPNGAGKTTTLRMLYTLMAPDQRQRPRRRPRRPPRRDRGAPARWACCPMRAASTSA